MSVHSTTAGADGHISRNRSWMVLPAIAVALALSCAACAQDQAAGAPPQPKLPANFTPPRPVPDVMTLEEELISKDDWDARDKRWKKDIGATLLTQALGAPGLNARIGKFTVAQIIEETIQLRVLKLSLPAFRDQIQKLRRDVYSDIHLNAPKGSSVREFALKQIVTEVEALLKCNFHVRVNAVAMLGELELVPANPGRTPAVPYSEALPVLLKVAQSPDKDQPEGVRIVALAGIERILRDGNLPTNPPSKLRLDAAQTLLKILADRNTSSWYQRKVITALQQVNLTQLADSSGSQKPLIAMALIDVISKDDRPIPVRCTAAHSLGKIPLPNAGIDTAALAKGMLKLTHDISLDYNQNRMKPTVAVFCVQDVYLGLDGLKKTYGNDKNVVTAYGLVLPVMKHLLRSYEQGAPIPNVLITPIVQMIAPPPQPGANTSTTSDERTAVPSQVIPVANASGRM